MSWRYIGPYLDPHRHVYVSGMQRQVQADEVLHMMDGLLAKDAQPLVARFLTLARQGASEQVLVYLADGRASGFTCRGDQFKNGKEMADAARLVFPELYQGHKVPFVAIEEPDEWQPQTSEPCLSEASASSTATKAPASKPGKPFSKSSA